jgi:hypothetical protein
MLFTDELTIPANTPATAPVRTTISLSPGTITEISVLFPPKKGAFVGVRILRFERVHWPTNPDKWIVADGETVDWDEDYDMDEEPFELHFEAYNTDDTFAHTVYFRVAVLESGRLEERQSAGLLGRIGEFLGLKS